jgi:hypothetical protein
MPAGCHPRPTNRSAASLTGVRRAACGRATGWRATAACVRGGMGGLRRGSQRHRTVRSLAAALGGPRWPSLAAPSAPGALRTIAIRRGGHIAVADATAMWHARRTRSALRDRGHRPCGRARTYPGSSGHTRWNMPLRPATHDQGSLKHAPSDSRANEADRGGSAPRRRRPSGQRCSGRTATLVRPAILAGWLR